MSLRRQRPPSRRPDGATSLAIRVSSCSLSPLWRSPSRKRCNASRTTRWGCGSRRSRQFSRRLSLRPHEHRVALHGGPDRRNTAPHATLVPSREERYSFDAFTGQESVIRFPTPPEIGGGGQARGLNELFRRHSRNCLRREREDGPPISLRDHRARAPQSVVGGGSLSADTPAARSASCSSRCSSNLVMSVCWLSRSRATACSARCFSRSGSLIVPGLVRSVGAISSVGAVAAPAFAATVRAAVSACSRGGAVTVGCTVCCCEDVLRRSLPTPPPAPSRMAVFCCTESRRQSR